MHSNSKETIFSASWFKNSLSYLLEKVVPNNKREKKKTDQIIGTQRPKSQASAIIRRKYDLEIEETPVRDYATAMELLEMADYCYEMYHVNLRLKEDAFASSDGDIRGWRVSPTLEDDETPVNSEVKAIADNLASRIYGGEYVIGGDRFAQGLSEGVSFGDSFLQMAIEKEGIGRNDYGISRTMYMPVYEMFRMETDTADLEGFEQRANLFDGDPYRFEAPKIIHIRHNKKKLYGRSLYLPALEGYGAWAKAKDAAMDIAEAIRAVGTNPTIHMMHEGASDEDKEKYKEDLRLQQAEGILTDLFLFHDQDVKKMANNDPGITALVDAFLQWRHILIPAGIPPHFIPGLDARRSGAKEISGVPALNYQRTVWGLRAMISKGIVQAINTEIIMVKGKDFFYKNGKYRLIWPEWNAVPFQAPQGNDAASNESKD